jgi:DnaJ like chaperone protein
MQQYTGKIIAGLIGFLTLGFVGLLFGVAIGHAFDRGLWSALQAASPEGMAAVQRQFFDTTFTLLGYIAKADGRVSEAEIAQAESLFAQLRLNPSQRSAAIEKFKLGSQADFDPQATVAAFAAKVGPRRQAQHTMFAILASMALADGDLAAPEREALHRVAALLGMPAAEVDRLVAMLSAQARFHAGAGYRQRGYSSGPAQSRDRLADAYQALGVASDVSDAELKRAYRKLMSENHPDKLMAKGVPDDLVKVATERSQEISNAYQVIRESRGLS